jgi:hypothetical protein
MKVDRHGAEVATAIREGLERRLPAGVADAYVVTVHQNRRGLTKATLRRTIEDATSRRKGPPISGQ